METTLLLRGDLPTNCWVAGPEDVLRVVVKRLEQPDARRRALLDGFPRTVTQAEALDTWLAQSRRRLNVVINLEVSEKRVVKRLLRRSSQHGRSDNILEAIGCQRPPDTFPRQGLDVAGLLVGLACRQSGT